jgi:hypothetical protein
MTNKLQSARGRSATPASRVALLLCSGLLLVTLCAGCRSAGDASVAFRPMYGVDMFPVPAGSRVTGPDGKPVRWTDEQGKVVDTTSTNGSWISGWWLGEAYNATVAR